MPQWGRVFPCEALPAIALGQAINFFKSFAGINTRISCPLPLLPR
jgi:hypothetical protein